MHFEYLGLNSIARFDYVIDLKVGLGSYLYLLNL